MRNLQGIMLLIGLTFLFFMPARGWSETDEELLNFLIAQNEAAREKAATVSYKIEWEYEGDTDQGHRFNKGNGEVKLDGERIWATHKVKANIPSTGWEQDQSGSLVLNENYFGYWPENGSLHFYRQDHQAIAEMDEKLKVQKNLLSPPAFFHHCFGGGQRPLRDTIKLHPGYYTWKAKKVGPGGKSLYRIERYNSKEVGDSIKPATVWLMDPDSGFAIVQILAYKQTGELFIDIGMELEQVSPDVWFPNTFEEKRYTKAEGAPGSTKLESRLTAKITDIQIKPPLPENQFEMESLGVPNEDNKHRLIRTRLDGQAEVWIYKHGGLVPEGLANVAELTEMESIDKLGVKPSTRPAENQVKPPASSPAVTIKETAETQQADNSSPLAWIMTTGVLAIAAVGVMIYRNKSRKNP